MKFAPHLPLHLPSLSALRAFECAARHSSFTLAAEELHLTQSAVSRQIKELEGSLGFALFRRNGRRVALTDAGASFAQELSVDLNRLRQTVTKAVAAGNEKTVLRIATLPTFACRWLIPNLPEFEVKFPDIEISLSTRLHPFSFEEDRFDLAIHHGLDDWPDTKMVKLCEEAIFPICSPTFRDAHGLNDVENLSHAPLLHLATRPNLWSEWFQQVDKRPPQTPRGKIFDQWSMIIAAATSGLGAGLLPQYLIEDEIEQGTLVTLSDISLPTQSAYYIVTPAGTNNPLVHRFSSWVKTKVRRNRT